MKSNSEVPIQTQVFLRVCVYVFGQVHVCMVMYVLLGHLCVQAHVCMVVHVCVCMRVCRPEETLGVVLIGNIHLGF